MRARNECWHYGGESMEVVKEYVYLGFTLTPSLSLEKHLAKKLMKSKVAINMTWKNCLSNDSVPNAVKHRIFEATSKSILFYGGHKESDTVERLLSYYLKRTFKLPMTTPTYMLHLETGLSPLYIQTLKLHADYICRTIGMDEGRMPKRITKIAISKGKLWFNVWKELAIQCGKTFELNFANVEECRGIFYDIIAAIDEDMMQRCIEKARQSVHREIYSALNYLLGENSYFSNRYNTEVISTIFQARGELLRLNFVPHREDLPLICNLCNAGVRENTIHFLGECAILREIRRVYWRTNYLNRYEVLEILNGKDWMKLFEFCKELLNYRKRIINELF